MIHIFSKMRKSLLAVLVTAVVCTLTCLPLCASDTGSCGTGLTYSLSDSGVLAVTGNGKMNDYIPSEIPWKDMASGVTSVVISDGVTSIGVNSFLNLPNVRKITLPASVTFISEHAFGYTHNGEAYSKIEGFSLSAPEGSAAEAYCTENGFDFQPIAKPDITGKCGNSLTWTLSYSGVLTVSGNGEMYDCASSDSTPWYSYFSGKNGYVITSVKISQGVTSIGTFAFSGAVKLRSAEIADTVTKLGKNCFSGCVYLEKITVPSSVTSIPESAFADCVSLSEAVISNGTTKLGDSAFRNTALASVSLPATVKSVGSHCFSGCEALASADIKSVSEVGDYAFFGCHNLSDLKLGNELTVIGSSAFEENISLVSVTFPNKLSKIGDRAFFGCSSLTSAVLPDSVVEFGKYCFSCCTSLKNAVIGNGVTTVSEGCFEACDALGQIRIGENASEICERAFTSCKALRSVTVPKSVKKIAEYSIGYYYFEDSDTGIAGTYAKYNDFVPEIISYSPTAAEEYARNSEFRFSSLGLVYSDSGKLSDTVEWTVNTATGVIIISGAGEIPDFISFNDTPWKYYRDHITAVVIGKDIVRVGSSCFENCDKITSVSIPGTVTEIGDYAFAGTSVETVSLPRSVNTVRDGAFAGCPKLRSVSLVDGLTYIGEKCFIGPNELKSVFVPESVSFIGTNALGYDRDETAVDGFIIRGIKNSSAFNYATVNSIDFRENGFIEITDKNNGCTVDILGTDIKGYELSLVKLGDSLEPDVYLSMNEYALPYEISLKKNGEIFEFDSQATVKFPIPASVNPITVRLFEIDADNNFKEIHADVEQGFFIFSTEKLGKYAVTNTDLSTLYTVEIAYIFPGGAKAADTVSFKASSGANFKIKSGIINGYTADIAAVSGTVENENISRTVTYSAGSSEVTSRTDTGTSKTGDSSGDPKKLLICVFVILIVLLISASLALILLNKKHSGEKKEKERIVSRVNRANADKYADTIVIPDSDQPTKEIDIQSLFADEPEEDLEKAKKIRKMRKK